MLTNGGFNVLLDSFTSNTYIMVIYSDPKIRMEQCLLLFTYIELAATQVNVAKARYYFEKLCMPPAGILPILFYT